MLYIRTDANGEIGTGHLMRCLAIAEEYRRCGGDAVFLIADDGCADIVKEREFSYRCLHSAWDDLEKETDILIRTIEEERIPLLLIDSYFITERYLSALRKHTIVAYMDDLNRFLYPVDLLINYNLYAEQMDYPRRYRNAGMDTRFALGCSYVPLREEFANARHEISEGVHKVLITTGGTDNYNVTEHLLAELCDQPWFCQLRFEVVVGKFNALGPELERRWGHYDNIRFYYNVANMAAHMMECDLAVTAGGSTVYELMACGTPAIVYSLADNQLDIVRTASDMGIMPWVGDVREDIRSCCHSAAVEIGRYMPDFERRQQVSHRMQGMVDGKGCMRIIKILDSFQPDCKKSLM